MNPESSDSLRLRKVMPVFLVDLYDVFLHHFFWIYYSCYPLPCRQDANFDYWTISNMTVGQTERCRSTLTESRLWQSESWILKFVICHFWHLILKPESHLMLSKCTLWPCVLIWFLCCCCCCGGCKVSNSAGERVDKHHWQQGLGKGSGQVHEALWTQYQPGFHFICLVLAGWTLRNKRFGPIKTRIVWVQDEGTRGVLKILVSKSTSTGTFVLVLLVSLQVKFIQLNDFTQAGRVFTSAIYSLRRRVPNLILGAKIQPITSTIMRRGRVGFFGWHRFDISSMPVGKNLWEISTGKAGLVLKSTPLHLRIL